MKPNFSLQNVLDVRHSKVEALEIVLGKLLQNQSAIENKLAMLGNLKTILMGKMEATLEGEIDLFTVDHLRMDVREVSTLMAQAEEELKKQVQMVEEKRRELITARQAEEVLGILKSKMIETYNSEQAQIEARNQDDLYIARGFRGQTQGV